MNNQKRFETPQIWLDTPVLKAEGSSFDFNAYAVTLARMIANAGTGTPMTISINGAWGSGKTSLMAQVRSLLLETEKKKAKTYTFAPDESKVGFRRCRTVWFNAWKYNQEDHILAGLLRAIILEMEKGNFIHQLRSKLEKREEKIDWLVGLLNAMVNFATMAAVRIPSDLKLDRLSKQTPLKSATSFFDYFDESFSRLLAC
jgi:gamma-glutamyl hercynylcysteine S-oxide synthase